MSLKLWMSWLSLGLAVAALPQAPPKGPVKGQSTVEWGSPDVTIVVKEHPTTADMVQITMARADYPVELLKDQIHKMGEFLGTPPRGLAAGKTSLDPNNKNLAFVKAAFATNGILNRKEKELNIEPVLKAFAGAPEPYTIDDVLIIFDGEKPGTWTVKKHHSDALEAEASFVLNPAEIEYHVHLKTQDSNLISFPSQAPEPQPKEKPSEGRAGTPVLFYGALGAGALAVGALVYLALLRGGTKARR